jgi:hypothetical protein
MASRAARQATVGADNQRELSALTDEEAPSGTCRTGFPNRQNTLMQVDVFQLQVQRFSRCAGPDTLGGRIGSDICDPSALLLEEAPVRLQQTFDLLVA